jgi:hypothetical protein
MNDDLDPSPMAAVPRRGPSSRRVWRNHELIIVQRGAELPPRCIRCNATAVHFSLRPFYWNPAWKALGTMHAGVPSLHAAQRAEVRIGLCTKHRHGRRNGLITACALPLLSLAACIPVMETSAARTHQELLVGFGVSVVIAAILIAQRNWDLLRAVRIDERVIHLSGASKAFLDSLDSGPA